MSLHDELTALQVCLDQLDSSVLRLAGYVGESHALDVRRVRTDAAHLRESVAMLEALASGQPGAPPPGRGAGRSERERSERERSELITIPDAPYDSALWTDSDDEGLGARDRHAP